jgi:hypothetical protein
MRLAAHGTENRNERLKKVIMIAQKTETRDLKKGYNDYHTTIATINVNFVSQQNKREVIRIRWASLTS